MSQNELLRRNSLHSVDEDGQKLPIIVAYEADLIDELKIQQKYKKLYSYIDYPICGSFSAPDLAPIRQKKRELQKQFVDGEQKTQMRPLEAFDGLFQQVKQNNQLMDNVFRQKIRMVRDVREEFFQQNGEFIIQKQFFSDSLSKIANISFDQNYAIKTLQKNAILSERNNQKKQNPFQIELSLGSLWFNKHPLNNEEEKKFEQIRPLLQEYARISTYPVLTEISKELKYLTLLRQNEDGNEAEELDKKIELMTNQYNEQKLRIETLMKKIITENNELRQIRRNSLMDTVPWKIHIKEYDYEGRSYYDIGVTSYEISDKIVAKSTTDAEIEQKRRKDIQEQEYFVKIYANDNQVGKSEKVKLQWPSFRVQINQKFSIMVYNAPSSFKIQIIKSGIFNHVVDTIYLSIPGINARTITSAEKRYAGISFCNNGKDYRTQLKNKAEDVKVDSQAPAGMLSYKIQWKGQGGKMPTINPKTSEEETACTEETQIDETEQIQLIFDQKDPRMPHKNLKQKVEANIKHRGNSLLPFIDVQSARHLLLKLKSTLPQIQKIQIPLTEEQIRHRQDLLKIIENEKERRFQDLDTSAQQCFNPLEGIFANQPEIVLKEIREILNKAKTLKNMASSGNSTVRYKITEQIINQYIFQQMESPIVIFFKNLFTQRRKLGPVLSSKSQGKSKIDELQINIHIRSAKNLPIRQSSFERIKNFQDEQNKMRMQNHMMNNNVATFDRFSGYGQGFFRQQPNFNMHGNQFFQAFKNQNRNQEVSYNDHYNLDRINGFIQMRFKKSIKRTRCFEGPFPEWNQTLFFNYSMKHEGLSLQKIFMGCEKSIKLFAFDMLEESKPTQKIAEARIKKSKYYLGRIDIPFSFLVAVPSITGLFKLDRPLLIFSYGIRRAGLFDFEGDPQQMNKTENPDIHTYVNLDFFSQPMIDSMLAYNADRKFVPGSGESPLILQRASDWLDELNTKRYVRLWLSNLEGKSIFICRFLSDNIAPPKLKEEAMGGSLIQRCARFVSLIPKKFNCKLLENTEEFHMRCDQFLNVKMGEDHGILLCNYFNFIDKAQGRKDYQSMLIIGKAFPYGKSIFVLRRNKITKNCEIWDPYQGQCYYFPAKEYETFCFFIKYQKNTENNDRIKDVCPLFEISCLVSRDNVYFNTQESLKPNTIDFDIENQSLWKAFLTQRTRNQLFQKGVVESIQHNISADFYPDLQKLQSSLESLLSQFVRENLQNERKSHFRPYTFKLNTRITNIISNKILPLCEAFKTDYRTTGVDSSLYDERQKSNYDAAVQKLQEERDRVKNQIPHEKNLFGFTLNFTYTTKAELFEKISETQIHLDENEDIEFVLSIRCFEYPCHIVSVWIFIGTIS